MPGGFEIMNQDSRRDEVRSASSHRTTWFVPDRPVEGTIFVLPAAEPSIDVSDSASSQP
jgi:hypothetical protein